MKLTPIDRFFAADCVKREVDAVHKEAKAQAQIYLDEARDNGQTSLISTYFGEEAGEYKRGRTRAKHVTEYNVCDTEELMDWLRYNDVTMFSYIKSHAQEFIEWLMNETGEFPDWVSKDEHDEPPTLKAPQIYRYDHELVKAKLAESGNILEGANQLLLGDGNE